MATDTAKNPTAAPSPNARPGLTFEAGDVQARVEASDVQAIVLRPRPKPYRGEYVVLRIDDAAQGREMLRRILPHVARADEWWVPSLPG